MRDFLEKLCPLFTKSIKHVLNFKQETTNYPKYIDRAGHCTFLITPLFRFYCRNLSNVFVRFLEKKRHHNFILKLLDLYVQ